MHGLVVCFFLFSFYCCASPISFETCSSQYTDSLKCSPPVCIHKYKFLGTWVLRVGTTEHDGLYKAAKSDFESFVESTSKEIVENVDDTIPELPLKDLVGILCFVLLAINTAFLSLHVWITMLCYSPVGFPVL